MPLFACVCMSLAYVTVGSRWALRKYVERAVEFGAALTASLSAVPVLDPQLAGACLSSTWCFHEDWTPPFSGIFPLLGIGRVRAI